MTARRCGWCEGALSEATRPTAIFCSDRCRTARHRFMRAVGSRGPVASGDALRMAYADVPSLRRSAPAADGSGVNWEALVQELAGHDAWAISCPPHVLGELLPSCPTSAGVAVWVRREPATRGGVGWEAVVHHGGRRLRPRPTSRTPASVLSTERRVVGPDVAGLVDPKPGEFARWVFELLGAQPGDTLTDLFPEAGGIARAWHYFTGPQMAHSSQEAS